MRSIFLIVSLAVLSLASPAGAQLVMGRVLDKQSRTPLRHIEVRLVPDTGASPAVLARATTDSSGDFYLDAPARGSYRLAFALTGATLLSAPFVVKDDDVQHEYELDTPPARTYFEFEVSKQAWPLPHQRGPQYPEGMRQSMIEGEVLVQFVVDTLGEPDMATFKVLRTPHAEFTASVRSTLPSLRFTPAEVGNRKVRQLVQEPFVFCLNLRALQSRPDTLRMWTPPMRPAVCADR